MATAEIIAVKVAFIKTAAAEVASTDIKFEAASYCFMFTSFIAVATDITIFASNFN